MSQEQESKIAFLPIKPVYAERLINGTKIFEFRRTAISMDLSHVIVYASSPKKRIVGILKVKQVNIGNPTETWEVTKSYAGITENDYKQYFSGKDLAYSIEVEPHSIIKFKKEFHPKEIQKDFVVPQSFKYVDIDFLKKVLKFGTPELIHA